MYGTLINGGAIALGGILGILFKKIIHRDINQGISQIMGVSILILSITGIGSSMLQINNDVLVSNDQIIVILSLIIGTVFGELMNLEKKTNSISFKSKNSQQFADGFMNSSLVFCVGALQILGPINSVISNDCSMLITKSLIDFPLAIALGMCFGISVAFSIIPVMLIQLVITLFAGFLNTFITPAVLSQISAIGYAIFLCAGMNMVFKTKTPFRTINMLPAIIIPVIVSIIKFYVG